MAFLGQATCSRCSSTDMIGLPSTSRLKFGRCIMPVHCNVSRSTTTNIWSLRISSVHLYWLYPRCACAQSSTRRGPDSQQLRPRHGLLLLVRLLVLETYFSVIQTDVSYQKVPWTSHDLHGRYQHGPQQRRVSRRAPRQQARDCLPQARPPFRGQVGTFI